MATILNPVIRVTSDGAVRLTDDGATRVSELLYVAAPEIDVSAILQAYFPGIVVQKNLVDALALWLIEHGSVGAADVAAILALANSLGEPTYPLTPLPYPYPAGLLRIPNSNPTTTGWTIVDDDKVVRGAGSGL